MCAGDARGDKKGTYPAAAAVGCVLKQTLIGGKQLKKALCVEKKSPPSPLFFLAPDKREMRNHPSSHSINRSLARQVLVI